ncbi:MAG: transcriptional repressor [Candidatus Kapabacteria bacterium]|nr:transcriptional repressor [Candidatus Kapabacteria bacterium]MCS7169292.1 transcriptional repressor [Candidatus Kapabacteria bacterium]MDW7997439.1 transcriptional repressor [Bacteroidota bacterium]MDW8225144.1 transcriptional repressor [Bacteroidota bacterium]
MTPPEVHTNHVDVEELKNRFASFLQEQRYRNTSERMRILERIAELPGHFTADQLYVYMHTHGDKVSRATIYSTLELLTQCNLVIRHRFEGDSMKYELTSRLPNHDHLFCVDCGRMVEFCAPQLQELVRYVARQYALSPVRHSLQIFARCPNFVECPHRP